jgi:RNA 3'-terminal phosphate cyclase (ATP)
VLIYSQYENITHTAVSFGKKGISRQQVAKRAVKDVNQFQESGAVVDEHLADQLLIPMALAGKGSFITTQPTDHTLTNCHVIKQFLDIDFDISQINDTLWKISVE